MSASLHRSVGMALSLACLVLLVVAFVKGAWDSLGMWLVVLAVITGFWWAFAGPRTAGRERNRNRS